MDLTDLVGRQPAPKPWSEVDKIPWNEPGFSRRMLAEHLSQAHDAASRRTVIIDRHVEWIHTVVLSEKPCRILDLGCGPGLYSQRLARLGHTCLGIDFSPASIAYARETAGGAANPNYIEADIRRADYGAGHDLALFLYGELNAFRPADASLILKKAWSALAPGGRLVLEGSLYDDIQRAGLQPPSWNTSPSGLFSENPHLCLSEHCWDALTATTIHRYYVMEAGSQSFTRYGETLQAYTEDGYRQLLTAAGFDDVTVHPGLTGDAEESAAFMVLVATKAASGAAQAG